MPDFNAPGQDNYGLINYGLLVEEGLPNRVWYFGGVSGIELEVLQQNHQWRSFIPDYEAQSNKQFDTSACVTYSALNCIETLLKRKYDQKINFSDRYTAVLSGTKPGVGNYFSNVAESLRRLHGAVDEVSCPFLSTMTTDDYYAPISQVLQEEGHNFSKEFTIQYEYVPDDAESLWDALQFSPVQVAFSAYGNEVGGVIQRTESNGNHAVMLYGGEYGKYFEIYDHYTKCFKKLAWNSKFWGAMRYNISKVTPQPPMPIYNFQENFRYFVADGGGGTLFFLAGKLRRDDLAKCLDQWIGRNDGNLEGKSKTITSAQLQDVKIYNLKGEIL